MRTRLHIQRKAPSKSSSAPITNPFRSRPFSPPTTEEEALLQQQATPDLQAQQQRTQGSGYNFANVSVTPRDPVSPLMLQPKLTIGEPGDKYEQEAGAIQRDDAAPEKEDEEKAPPVQAKLQSGIIQRDDAAPEKEDEEKAPPVQAKLQSDTIQRDEMPPEKEDEEKAPPVQAKLQSGIIQRDDMAPEKEDEEKAPPVQAKLQSGTIQRDDVAPEKEDEEKAPPVQAKSMVQRQSDGGGMAAPPQLEQSIQQARGSGQPLADNIRKPMEQSFGADFSGVKVHTDAQSDQLNQSIQARAFTTGQDIFFREGNYNPGSLDGQELVAHELAHVVQQSGGALQQKPSE